MDNQNIGVSKNVKSLFRFIDDSKQNDIDEFVMSGLVRDYQRFSSVPEVVSVFSGPGYISYDDAFYIRKLSGYNYFDINSALRDRWSYDENGNVSRKNDFLKIASKISHIIASNSHSFGDFVTYRGVSLSYFKDYGIDSLEDLKCLEGKFLFDKGFVSTSLVESSSFFKKSIEPGKDYNVKIEYLVPSEFEDGIYIGGNSTFTYRPEENEYLINGSNLARVASVRIEEDNTATLTAVMIPKSIYDDYYRKKESSQK